MPLTTVPLAFQPLKIQPFAAGTGSVTDSPCATPMRPDGATVVVIEHDLDVIRNADFIIDMGPGGGEEGGLVVAAGTLEEIAGSPNSVTGQYLK